MDGSSCSGARFCGVPGFTGFSSPYRLTCFGSAFASSCSEPSLNCISTYRTRGNCYFDAECDSGNCANGQCAPADLSFPRVVNSLSYNDYLKYMNGVTGGSMAGVPKAMCKQGMIMVQRDGKSEPYCPIPNEPGTMPVCQQAYQQLWQCDQFKDKSQPGSQQAYEQCKRFQDCFAYNVEYPDGSMLPVAVKMNSECLGAAAAAVQQTASRCATCQPSGGATCSSAQDLLAPFVLSPQTGGGPSALSSQSSGSEAAAGGCAVSKAMPLMQPY